jgi:hypothetical protein
MCAYQTFLYESTLNDYQYNFYNKASLSFFPMLFIKSFISRLFFSSLLFLSNYHFHIKRLVIYTLTWLFVII